MKRALSGDVSFLHLLSYLFRMCVKFVQAIRRRCSLKRRLRLRVYKKSKTRFYLAILLLQKSNTTPILDSFLHQNSDTLPITIPIPASITRARVVYMLRLGLIVMAITTSISTISSLRALATLARFSIGVVMFV